MPRSAPPAIRRRRTLIAVTAAGLLAAGCGASASGHAAGAATPVTAAPDTAPPAPSGYAQWPEAERDATHSSAGAARGPQSAHSLWKVSLGGPISQGPSIGADGTVYVSTDAGVLHAISPARGRTRWTFNGHGSMGGDLSTTAAILPDGDIAWPGPRHTVYGLSPAGHLLWTVGVGGYPLSPVVAAPGEIYEMTLSGVLSAIRVQGGRAVTRWRLKVGTGVSYGSPVIRRDGVIETTVGNSLVAVRDLGGSAQVLWRFAVTKNIEVSPAVSASGVTVLGTNDGFEYGVSPAGKQLWKVATGTLSYSSPAVTSGGTAYFGDNDGVLTVAAAATGTVSRKLDAHPGADQPTDNIWTAAAVDRAGDVYYGTHGGEIYGYTAAGRQLFAIATGKTVASYPALSARGDLFIGSANGFLYCIGR